MCDTALPGSAWGPTLLCCVTVFLLGTGSANPGVLQSPRHIIKAEGGRSILKCIPISGHSSVSWYKQTPGQEPEFLIQHYEKMERAKGNMPTRFSVHQFSDYHSEMNISTLQWEDSAMYFCASSPTALHKHMEAAVTQDPRNKMAVTGKKVTLDCHQTYGHNYMYWYRQDMGHGLKLIHYSYGVNSTEKGDIPDGYKVNRPYQEDFSLILDKVSPSQTAVYFCASSDTQQCVTASPLHIKLGTQDALVPCFCKCP